MINSDVSLLPTTDLAYMAGIIDGEGCIKMYRLKGRGGNINHCCLMAITNTNKDLISWIHQRFGGVASVQRNSIGRPYWRWTCGMERQKIILPAIIPYLISKKSEAEYSLYFMNSKVKASPGSKVSDGELARREACFSKFNSIRTNSPPNDNTVSNEVLAYAAGAFDGEGNFFIRKHVYGDGRNDCYSCSGHLSGCHPGIPQWMAAKFGGKVSHRERRPPNHDVFTWNIYSNGLRRMIPNISKYLIIKRDEAIAMFSMLALTDSVRAKKGRWGKRRKSIEEMAKYEEIYQSLRGRKKKPFDADGPLPDNPFTNPIPPRKHSSKEEQREKYLRNLKRGSTHRNAKLTESKVAEIRRMRESGIKQRYIAGLFGVTEQAIHAIIRRRTWKHI